MRKLLLTGLAGLLLAGPALADQAYDGRRNDDRRDWQGDRGDRIDDRRDDRQDWRDDRRDDRRDWRDDRRDDRQDFRADYRGAYRYDSRWNGARYRGPVYVHPRGLGYRAWGVGYRVPRAYFDNRYYIGNPGLYRLPPAYYGTRWVRVGADALLIGVRDGIVIRAVRGLYW